MCASWTPKATVQVGFTIEIQILALHGIFAFRGRVPDARKHCVFASDWLKLGTLPQKSRTPDADLVCLLIPCSLRVILMAL